MKRQLDRLDLVSRAYHSDNLGAFCEAVATAAGLDACLPMNTGAEAVETAIKAARRYGYDRLGIAPDNAEIIVAENNFHGRTTTIIGFSTEPAYRRGFGPFAPGFLAFLSAMPRLLSRNRREHGRRSHRADPGRSRDHRARPWLSRRSAAHLQ